MRCNNPGHLWLLFLNSLTFSLLWMVVHLTIQMFIWLFRIACMKGILAPICQQNFSLFVHVLCSLVAFWDFITWAAYAMLTLNNRKTKTLSLLYLAPQCSFLLGGFHPNNVLICAHPPDHVIKMLLLLQANKYESWHGRQRWGRGRARKVFKEFITKLSFCTCVEVYT